MSFGSNSAFPTGRQAKDPANERSLPSSFRGGGLGVTRNAPNGRSSSAASTATKKLVIKPFKVQPKIPDNFGVETWQKLKSALDDVYSKNVSTISKEELYRAVEDLCVQKMGAKTYDLLREELQRNITTKVALLSGQTSDSNTFLGLVDAVWLDHTEQLNTTRNIFLYLDRSYALQQHSSGVKLIWDMGNDIFRQQLDQLPQIRQKIIAGLLGAVERLRSGSSSWDAFRVSPAAAIAAESSSGSIAGSGSWVGAADAELVGRISTMLNTLQLYPQFEHALLRDSERFFSVEGSQLIGELDPARFLHLVDRRLAEVVEVTGPARLLDPGSRKPLLEIVEQCLLRPHLGQLIERGFKMLMEDDRVEDLRRMFSLFSRVQSLPMLQQAWGMYARMCGEALVSNASGTAGGGAASTGAAAPLPPAAAGGGAGAQEGKNTFVEDVLNLHSKLERILKLSFFDQDMFKHSMKSAFEHFVNINLNNSAALIARFVDRKLRGEKGVSEAEVELKLDQVMMLFRYIQEKDIFEAFYKKHLSKRLLLGKSASYELERIMLSKLKTECGSNYTSKLEGMFQDVELSRECQQAFKQYLSNLPSSSSSGGGGAGAGADACSALAPSMPLLSSSSAISHSPGVTRAGETDMQIQVLTTGYWPSAVPTDTLVLPPELQALMRRFNDFYIEKYQGRRLAWAHSLERCVVAARFPKGKKDLEVSLFQALVLKCFNKTDRLAYADIKQQTGIETGELKRTLQSLACGMVGTRVLVKDPKGRDVADDDHFLFNDQFTNRLFRIKINTIQLKETAEEVEKTNEEVFRDREYQVDAAIVRTMKARKRLPHTTLIAELLTQLRFPAQTADIKKRIESLIERDYLERDADDSTVYNYLA